MKEIEIKTINDFIESATEENYERLVHDFLIFSNKVMRIKKKYPDIEIESMLWTDDGENKLTGIIINGDKIEFNKD